MSRAIKYKVTVSYTNTAEKADYKESFVVEEADENRAIFAAAKLFYVHPEVSAMVIKRLTVTNLTPKKKAESKKEETEVTQASSLPAPENEGDTPGDPPAA